MAAQNEDLSAILGQLGAMLNGGQGGNLMEKLESLKSMIPGDLHDKLTGLLGQLGGEGGIAGLLSMLEGGQRANPEADAPANAQTQAVQPAAQAPKQEHVDLLKGVMGEIGSLLSSAEKGAKEEGKSGLGGIIGSVLKAVTEKE